MTGANTRQYDTRRQDYYDTRALHTHAMMTRVVHPYVCQYDTRVLVLKWHAVMTRVVHPYECQYDTRILVLKWHAVMFLSV